MRDWDRRKLEFAASMYELLKKREPMAKKKAPPAEQQELPTAELLPELPQPESVMVADEGYFDMPMQHYLADPAPEVSLSKGSVRDLIYRTARRAHYNHPRLGGAESPDASRANMGTAVHNAITGGREIVYAPAEFKDWRKDAVKAWRDEAYAKWQVPLLDHERSFVTETAERIREVLASFGTLSFERTMVYKHYLPRDDGGDPKFVWVRGRGDIDTNDGAYDIDLKSATNADPIDWVKFAALRGGYDVQAAIRHNGHLRLGKRPREMLWLVIEFEPPYDIAVLGVTESLLTIGRKKLDVAAQRWRACLDSDKWPSYGDSIIPVQAPPKAEWDLADRT